jgi:hypothetical protein
MAFIARDLMIPLFPQVEEMVCLPYMSGCLPMTCLPHYSNDCCHSCPMTTYCVANSGLGEAAIPPAGGLIQSADLAEVKAQLQQALSANRLAPAGSGVAFVTRDLMTTVVPEGSVTDNGARNCSPLGSSGPQSLACPGDDPVDRGELVKVNAALQQVIRGNLAADPQPAPWRAMINLDQEPWHLRLGDGGTGIGPDYATSPDARKPQFRA